MTPNSMSFVLAHESKNNVTYGKSSIPAKPYNRDNEMTRNSQGGAFPLLHASDNHTVSRFTQSSNFSRFDFARINIYPKLKISQTNDLYEREADRIAENVMRENGPDKEHREIMIQRLTIPQIAIDDRGIRGDLESRLNTENAGGNPLSNETRAFFEPRFNFGFSAVRIHTNNEASQISEELGAKAFTHGRDIYFGAGQYDIQSNQGKALLAHELSHVVQQSRVENSRVDPFASQHAVSTIYPFIQRREFGENVRFDSLSGLPPRATILAPYRNSAIAEELYGDPTVPITYLSAVTISIDYDQLLPRWRSYFDRPNVEERSEHNSWPFPGFSTGDIHQYIDERASAVAINLVSGRVFITVEGLDQSSEVPLRWFTTDDLDVIPIVPPRRTREEAVAEQSQYEYFHEQRGLTPVLFYRDSNGLIWPTIINPQTAPNIMSVYSRAFEAARQEVVATHDAFVDLLWWYVGARLAGPAQELTNTTGRLIISRGASLSSQEMAMAQRLVNEGYTVRVLAESTRQGERTADFLVNGIRTELKTISNLTSRDISGALGRRILEGAGQGSHIIADVRGQTGMTFELAERAIRRAYGADTLGRIQQIRLIGRDFDITIPRTP